MKKQHKDLVEQLKALDAEDYQRIHEAVIKAKQDAEASRIKARRRKPKQIPAAEFKELVKQAKEFMKGRKITSKQKLVLDVESECHFAWATHDQADIVAYRTTVKSPRLSDFALDQVAEDLECYPSEVVDPAIQLALSRLDKEIGKYCGKLKKLEKKLGLEEGALWDAIYAKVERYSQF